MAFQAHNNPDESANADQVPLTDRHGRFPQLPRGTSVTEVRVINVDELSESDFDGMRDSGLPYSDHDYIGSNPNVRCIPEPGHFPILKGLSDQYLSGESKDITLESERSDNRPSSSATPMVGTAATLRKAPLGSSGLQFRAITKAEEYPSIGPHLPAQKTVQWHSSTVTQPKKSGRPPKNEVREPSGNRLIGRAMVRAGMDSPHVLIQPHPLHPQQRAHPMGDMMQGAAPIVTPARGQKIQPRGRSVARREAVEDGSGGYALVTMQQHQPMGPGGSGPFRTPTITSPRKVGTHYRSAQAAEDAHTREMMEAAQNALAPVNSTISGHALLGAPHHAIVLPVQHQQLLSQPPIRPDDNDLPRTPGKMHHYSPHTPSHVRTTSESNEGASLFLQEPIRMHPDGRPITPGGKTAARTRSARSRMSTSESTASGSQPASPQRQPYLSPGRQGLMQPSRANPPLHHRQMIPAAHLKNATGGHPILPLAHGPSTMASAQLQMASNAPMPSLHNQAYQQPQQLQMPPPPSRPIMQQPGTRQYYDQPGHAAPLITASGSNSYTPRRRKEKDADEAVEAEVSRNVQNILQAEKTHRLSTTSSHHTLSPREEAMSEDDTARPMHQVPKEFKRSPMKRAQQKNASKQTKKEAEAEEEKWEVECICGERDDDGEEMVSCDTCIRWQHVDCIFPRTKKAPEGSYYCTVCRPRETDLSPELARQYQDRRRSQKRKEEEEKEEEANRKKLAERKKKKEENMRKSYNPASRVSSHSKLTSGGWKANEKAVPPTPPPNFKEITTNVYSRDARRFLNVSRTPGMTSNAEIVKILAKDPRIQQILFAPRVYGLMTLRPIDQGSYIAELCGYVTLKKEGEERELTPGFNNDFTFSFEKDGESIIVDARKMGNQARFVRRSCKPNAALQEIMAGSEFHIMITATQAIDEKEEVTISFDEEWRKRSRPLQECACGKPKECEVVTFYEQVAARAQSYHSMPSTSRRSLPANGTTPKVSSNARRVATEKKKKEGSSAKKSILKKGKKRGTIKLPRPSRKSKTGSTSTGDEETEADETETEKEYEESTGDEKEVKMEVEEKTPRGGRTRRNTASTSEVKKEGEEEAKEEPTDKMEMPVLQATRSSTRIRTDSEAKKEENKEVETKKQKEETKEAENKKNDEKVEKKDEKLEKKTGRKSAVDKEVKEEVKEEPTTPAEKKTDKKKTATPKAWPVMDYTLPSERNKPSREERKNRAIFEQMNKSAKMGGDHSASRGSSTRGRSSSVKTPVLPSKEPKVGSSGRGKRKAEEEGEAARADSATAAAAATPLTAPPKKRWAAAEEKKRAEAAKESPAPSSLSSSMASPLREETSAAASPAGRKRGLSRHEEQKAAAAASEKKSATSSKTSTPSRASKRGGKEKKGGDGEDLRAVMRREVIHLRARLPITSFSLGDMVKESRPSTSVPSLPPPPPPPLPATPEVAATEVKTQRKTIIGLDEYRKRKQSAAGAATAAAAGGTSEKKKEEKKSFMPSVADTANASSSYLPHVELPMEDVVTMEELKRRVYGESPKKGGASTSSVKGGGPVLRTPEASKSKTESAPKARQSINDRLKNEFALPTLSSSSPALSITTSSSGVETARAPSISPSPSGGGAEGPGPLTPTTGRPHKNRLSQARAMNVEPPGLIECPRPRSLMPPPSSTPTTPSTPSTPSTAAPPPPPLHPPPPPPPLSSTPLTPKPSTPAPSSATRADFAKRAASIRSSK